MAITQPLYYYLTMVAPIASLQRGVLRPRDASRLYVQPRSEFLRLEKTGVLLKVAHGYYAVIPEANRGREWRPDMEAIALGIGQADYGKEAVSLMHISAARIHGAIPRAIGVAVLAVPKQRPTLETKFGRIFFVKRNVGQLRRIRIATELGSGWTTNLEQTALDLAKRENLISDFSDVSREAAIALVLRIDKEKLQNFAKESHLGSSLEKVETWVANARSA